MKKQRSALREGEGVKKPLSTEDVVVWLSTWDTPERAKAMGAKLAEGLSKQANSVHKRPQRTVSVFAGSDALVAVGPPEALEGIETSLRDRLTRTQPERKPPLGEAQTQE